MRATDFRKLKQMAYREYKVTRQISTGNGETFLAASERPPGGFVAIELGYGISERPCLDCHKPCTLDYTLANLEEINARNQAVLAQRDGEDLGIPVESPKKQKRRSATESARRHRATLRAAGVSVVKGEYVDRREWVPRDPNAKGRKCSRLGDLIAAHRENQVKQA